MHLRFGLQQPSCCTHGADKQQALKQAWGRAWLHTPLCSGLGDFADAEEQKAEQGVNSFVWHVSCEGKLLIGTTQVTAHVLLYAVQEKHIPS